MQMNEVKVVSSLTELCDCKSKGKSSKVTVRRDLSRVQKKEKGAFSNFSVCREKLFVNENFPINRLLHCV
jgi:hypothetical protein